MCRTNPKKLNNLFYHRLLSRVVVSLLGGKYSLFCTPFLHVSYEYQSIQDDEENWKTILVDTHVGGRSNPVMCSHCFLE
jgi:hypothetical protein